MGELTLVKPDEKIIRLLTNYHVLVEGNTVLKLAPIPPVEPLVASDDTNVIPFKPKVQELTDKVHQAASQLNKHYDKLADSDYEFQPYWSQERTFSQAVEGFPKLENRKFFRSYKKFFKKNHLPERRELEKRLNYFHPFFYDKKSIPDNMRKAVRSNVDMELMNLIACCGLGMMTLTSFLIQRAPEVSSALRYGMTAFCYIGVPLTSYGINKQTKHIERKQFEKVAHKPLVYKSGKADEMISLIKDLK